MKRVGSPSVLLLAALCATSTASPQVLNPSGGDQPSDTQAELLNPPTGSLGSSEGTHKRSALLTNFPSFRQSTRPESPHEYHRDHYRPGYRTEDDRTLSHVPLVRSFQSASHVHDVVPSLIFFHEKRQGDAVPPPYLTGQTATQTERSSVVVSLYFDEHDEHLGLTDIEERVKIYYNGNRDLVPPFHDWKKLAEAKKKQNRLFNYFKTQRANFVI